MKSPRILLVTSVLVCVSLCSGAEKTNAEGSYVAGRWLACTDYSQGKVVLVAPDGHIAWETASPSCNDLWALANGNLLFNTGRGVREVTREGATVFEYVSNSEVYACQRLPNGNTFVGECNSGRMLELAPDLKVVNEVRLLPEGTDGGHVYARNARRLPNGNTLVAHYGMQVVREYDPAGTMVWEAKAPGGPHSVTRAPNGNTLIATGDMNQDPRLVEVDADGTPVWEVSNADLEGEPLRFLTGFQRLPNGNTLLSNWLGHGHLGKGPHLLEITPDKKVVWTYANHKDLRTVSSVVVLDAEGNPEKDAPIH